uniref:Ral GTPase activating protein catalytic subunit alpha 2 n=1 Tax=Callorhinchus milii TaxID=7868 RepID=A0A4W3K391_CALMI
MFSRKGHGDVKKSAQKVLDPKKDVLTRLKHLRALVDILERSELKQFFETNYSQIYFIFFENLFTLESSLKQKGNKSQREELDSILFLFEKILQLLPEKINSKWQFHSIGSILKKLLHTGNSVKIRCEGIRLFLLWIQALQENCSDEQLMIFACLVPGFPAVLSQIGPCTLDTLINPTCNMSDAKVAPEEIAPLLPPVLGEKLSDDTTCFFLQALLKYMVIQAASLEWKSKEKQESGFKFLFALFKRFYLFHLFPSFTKFTNLYDPLLEIPQMRPAPYYIPARNNESNYSTRDQYLAARVAFIKWLVTFFLEKKYTTSQNTKNGGEMLPKIIQSVTANPLTQDKANELETNGTSEQDRSHSNSSTLSDRRLSASSICSIEEEHRTAYEMVQKVLLSNRANVNFINEVFHQAFRLPSCEASATKNVIKVYRKWILQENKPLFMAEPEKMEIEEDAVDDLNHLSSQFRHRRTSSWGRTYSFTNAINRGCVFEEEDANIQAGTQATLQVFLTNSANVFLLEPCADIPKFMANQMDVCKAVLSIYRHMIMELTMSRKTWEQLLRVLLKITETVMQKPLDMHKRDIFAENMSGLLFRTLIVAWIRASLNVFISRELWDELLSVLSSLTAWNELIIEWAKIMDSLTVVLARCVYGLDMNDLPLEKLSEQKEKKQRGRGVCQDLNKVTGVGRSFSLSWRTQTDCPPEHMRFRSATTSGAPGVEKARNVVRQKLNCFVLCLGESVSSETSNGFSSFNETDVSLPPWKTFDEESEAVVTDVVIDADASHSWQQLYPSDASTLTGQLNISCSIKSILIFLFHFTDSSECLADECSIIAGGSLTGWHADAAAVLWRRILGILGDVNCIRCPKIHARVFEYLCDLWQKLAKIRDNLGISLDNQTSPQSPVLIPPLRMFVSWLFKATTLSIEYKEGKLQAYKLICDIMTKRQDVLPNIDFLVHFYHVMHRGIVYEDQDVLNTLIKHCSPRFFLFGLPGFSMMIGDFITAATKVLSLETLDVSMIILSQWAARQLTRFRFLHSDRSDTMAANVGGREYSSKMFHQTAKNEKPYTSVCSIGIWICEELVECTNHAQVKDALNVLGVTLKFSNKVVAEVACDVLQLLVTHWERMKKYEFQLPKKITEILVATIAFLLPSAEHSSVDIDKRLIVSLLLCLLDWCMAIPVETLLEPISASILEDQITRRAPLLDYIYRVLHSCVCGSHLFTQQSQYLLTLADVSSTDYDPFLTLGNVKNSESTHSYVSKDIASLLTVTEGKKKRSLELIPLTARMVMAHLINHLGHYPLSGGPAILYSLISENHDNPHVESSDLSAEVFKSPNLQLFVLNDSTLISYLQIPAEEERTLSSEPKVPASDVRVIVRDISGKYSWDGQILYGPFDNQMPCCKDCKTSVSSNINKMLGNQLDTQRSDPGLFQEDDDLDKLLEDLGNSSPECLPHPQLNISEPSPAPLGMSCEQERDIIDSIIRQNNQEEEYIRRWNRDPSMSVACQKESVHHEPQALFYYCKLFLNDMGMNSWDRRNSFHLLKKNSKLLRELKNLDSRQCRETHKIAVFYIAEGQEDKCSILSNTRGSQAYEDFVSGLGWEINLSTHCGFMGGLQRNGSTGQTAPYYATSTVEVIFHVSSRMPSDSDDSITKKLRHLGNDEIHIIWSEHTRDYRRGIIPTDFGDVLIIIYPMKNHMFYIQILKKPEVPFFGPLFDGAIVNGKLLPSLVRVTGINASRAVKTLIPLYQGFYEERAQYVEAIVQQHKEIMTFEDFAAQVFSPTPSYSLSNMGKSALFFYLWSISVTDVHQFSADKRLQIQDHLSSL